MVESNCNAGDLSLIPGLGRFSGEEYGNTLQYSCLLNPKDSGACQATVLEFSKESDKTEQLCIAHSNTQLHKKALINE